MRAWLGLILLLGGCSGVEGRQPAGAETTQSESAAPIGCVEVGGGELQAGLKLGLGGGDVTVTDVQHKGGSAVGFTVSSTAPQFFFIVTAANVSCTRRRFVLERARQSRASTSAPAKTAASSRRYAFRLNSAYAGRPSSTRPMPMSASRLSPMKM